MRTSASHKLSCPVSSWLSRSIELVTEEIMFLVGKNHHLFRAFQWKASERLRANIVTERTIRDLRIGARELGVEALA